MFLCHYCTILLIVVLSSSLKFRSVIPPSFFLDDVSCMFVLTPIPKKHLRKKKTES